MLASFGRIVGVSQDGNLENARKAGLAFAADLAGNADGFQGAAHDLCFGWTGNGEDRHQIFGFHDETLIGCEPSAPATDNPSMALPANLVVEMAIYLSVLPLKPD